MIEFLTSLTLDVENMIWTYFGLPIVLLLGVVLSVQSRFAQVRHLPSAIKTFLSMFRSNEQSAHGIHPLKAFFAGIGGSVGVGNVVGVCTAVQIGGPGALLWIWLTAVAGAIVKYSEVYLGMQYRVPNEKTGGYNGGPMYFLQKAFKQQWILNLVAALLCLYGVEIFQFSVITKSVSTNFDLNHYAVVGAALLLILLAASGGVKRVGSISGALIPVFVFCYVGMGLWVLISHIGEVPGIFYTVFSSAFNGHAAVGGFIGSTILTTASQGIRRGCYTADIGIGYAAVIHSETNVTIPEKQASLVIFEIFIDTFFVCTTSVLLILTTGVWQESLDGAMLVQEALGQHFPYMEYFIPLFLFLVGYATINAYFCVGLKCAQYLMPKLGLAYYYTYAVIILIACAFIDTRIAQSIMASAGGLLLVVNGIGIFMLRREISFDLSEKDDKLPAEMALAMDVT